MKKKIPKEVSEYYRELARKGVKARHAKIMAKSKEMELSTG
jgi:hypothetical protein